MSKILPDQWVLVHRQFRGRVVRIRKHEGTTYFDVEIGGVVLPYTRNEIKPSGDVKNVS